MNSLQSHTTIGNKPNVTDTGMNSFIFEDRKLVTKVDCNSFTWHYHYLYILV